jgi:hypothetical protein
MRRFSSIAPSIFLLLSFATFGYFLAIVPWRRLGELNPNVVAAIIAALAAITGALYTQRQTRLREIQESHREPKIKLYEKFMDIIDKIMDLSRQNRLAEISENSVPAELEELLRELRRGLLIWASPGVIRAYERFLFLGQGGGFQVLQGADEVFRSIRKDLGNSNWGLAHGDLIKLFLKDPSEYDRMMASSERPSHGARERGYRNQAI